MALPKNIINGTATITHKDGSHTVTTVLNAVKARIKTAKDGPIQEFPASAVGGNETGLKAFYSLYVGGYDENAGSWKLVAGDRVTFTGNSTASAILNGTYEIMGEPLYRAGPPEKLAHVKALIVKLRDA